jgi:hypothetical protein
MSKKDMASKSKKISDKPIPSGVGRAVRVGGLMIYDGEFKKGMPEGYGRCVWWNGAHYVGNWADGEMHG